MGSCFPTDSPFSVCTPYRRTPSLARKKKRRRDLTAKTETHNFGVLLSPRAVSCNCSTIHGCILTDEI